MSMHRRVVPGAALAVMGLLTACMQNPPEAPASTTRLYAIDQTGAAKQCKVGPVALAAGKPAATTMTVANDGGWCAISVAADGRPYGAGLLTVDASHGKVYVHQVGDATRIDYTPDRGFVGPNSFTVTLLPGRPVLRVAVTVTR